MSIAAAYNLLGRVGRALGPCPIFTKELRVGSRRLRYYVLRCVYLLALTSAVVVYWLDAGVGGPADAAYVAAHMSEVGKSIVTAVAWFQFVAAQVLGLVLLSNAISSELRQRTLGLLMTTPVTGLQIVGGKLLSKLWQVLLLLAISLPVMAVVRVFGGVPWGFLVCTLGVTVTAALLVGAFTLCFSIGCSHPISAMWRAALLYGMAFFGSAWLTMGFTMALRTGWPNIWVYCNPFLMMLLATDALHGGNVGSQAILTYWPIHCVVMLGFTGLVLLLAANKVRRVALAAVVRAEPTPRRKPRPAQSASRTAAAATAASGAAARTARRKPSSAELRQGIRRVGGAPLVWKELRFYMPAGRKETVLASLAVVAVVACSYAGMGSAGLMDYAPVHVLYGQIYFWAGAVVAAVLAAGAISAERRGGTLTLLLTTPLTDGQVVFAKGVGVFRQALPAWLFLFGHVVLFTALLRLHPLTIVFIAGITIATAVFLTGIGLYWSTRLCSTSSSVIAAGVVVLALWLAPAYLLNGSYDARLYAEHALSYVPLVQMSVVIRGCVELAPHGGAAAERAFEWPHRDLDLAGTAVLLGRSFAAHTVVGLAFAWRAKALLRRKLFG
jgi:ABC-type transport system involved in multi-copper enzyme maturation permease subunit